MQLRARYLYRTEISVKHIKRAWCFPGAFQQIFKRVLFDIFLTLSRSLSAKVVSLLFSLFIDLFPFFLRDKVI